MIRRLLVLFLCLLAVAPSAVAVATAASTTTVKSTSDTSNKVLSVNVDHGISLTLSEPATSVFIANPDIADVQVMSSTSIMVFGKRTGSTTFMATDANGKTLANRTVIVTQDMTDLRRELDSAMPGNKIHAVSVPNGIVLTGEAKDAATVTDAYKMAMRYLPSGGDIINRIKVAGSNQIHIRVRFAEVQRNIDNSLGINWENMIDAGGFMFGLATGISGAAAAAGGPAVGNALGSNITTTPNILSNRPNNSILNQPNDLLTFQHAGNHVNINGLIDALAQDGLITILAEPNLTAMSGETANFLAGGEFPITIPQGNGTISIEFKSYGISLAFTPTLINDDRISLHVKPEVSELTSVGSVTLNNNTVPALTTRRAETTVEVASGQSFAIAGLLDNSQSQTINKYPLLGDLPILGALFRSTQFQNGQTELVIIITPYIVKPSSNEQLALPTDRLSPPNEEERLIGERYSSANPDARPQSGEPIAVRGDPSVDAAPVVDVTPVPMTNTAPSIVAPPAAPTVTVMPPVAPTMVPAPMPEAAGSPVLVAPAPSVSSAPVLHINPARAAPSNLSPGVSVPSGPGGFILE